MRWVGARHDYPEQTFMTVQEGGCGTGRAMDSPRGALG